MRYSILLLIFCISSIMAQFEITSPLSEQEVSADTLMKVTWDSGEYMGWITISMSWDNGTSWCQITSLSSQKNEFSFSGRNFFSSDSCRIKIEQHASDSVLALTEPFSFLGISDENNLIPNGEFSAGTVGWRMESQERQVQMNVEDGLLTLKAEPTPTPYSDRNPEAIQLLCDSVKIKENVVYNATMISATGSDYYRYIRTDFSKISPPEKWYFGFDSYRAKTTGLTNSLLATGEKGGSQGTLSIQLGKIDSLFKLEAISLEEYMDSAIIITAPIYQETLYVNQDYQIQWATSGDIDTVNIWCSYDNAFHYQKLANHIPNEGVYSWTPETISKTAFVRVTTTTDSLEGFMGQFYVIADTTMTKSVNTSTLKNHIKHFEIDDISIDIECEDLITDVKIYSMQGRELFHKKISNSSQYKLTPSLSTGLYLIKLSGLNEKGKTLLIHCK